MTNDSILNYGLLRGGSEFELQHLLPSYVAEKQVAGC